MSSSVTKFLVIRDSTNNGAPVTSLGTSGNGRAFASHLYNSVGTSCTVTIGTVTGAVVPVTYDPSSGNGPCGGYIAITLGTDATPTTLIAGDLNPAINFSIEEVNAVQFVGQVISCSGAVTIPAATLASTTNITSATGVTLGTNSIITSTFGTGGTCVLPETTKTNYLPSVTAGAAGGVFIAGVNAATTFTTLTVVGAVTFQSTFTTTGATVMTGGQTISGTSNFPQSGDTYGIAKSSGTGVTLISNQNVNVNQWGGVALASSTIPAGWIGTSANQISVSAGIIAASTGYGKCADAMNNEVNQWLSLNVIVAGYSTFNGTYTPSSAQTWTGPSSQILSVQVLSTGYLFWQLQTSGGVIVLNAGNIYGFPYGSNTWAYTAGGVGSKTLTLSTALNMSVNGNSPGSAGGLSIQANNGTTQVDVSAALLAQFGSNSTPLPSNTLGTSGGLALCNSALAVPSTDVSGSPAGTLAIATAAAAGSFGAGTPRIN